jgi:hypothetical protein
MLCPYLLELRDRLGGPLLEMVRALLGEDAADPVPAVPEEGNLERHFFMQWNWRLQSVERLMPQQQSSLQTGQPPWNTSGPCSTIIFSEQRWQ